MAINDDAAAFVERLRKSEGVGEHLAQRRCLHARGPESAYALDPLIADHHVSGPNIGDVGPGAHAHAELCELLDCLLLQVLGIGAKDVRRAFQDEHVRR